MLEIDKYNYFTIKSPYLFIKDEHGDEAENDLVLKSVSKINNFKRAFDLTTIIANGTKRIFEIDAFESVIAHYDGPARNTKAGKEAWAKFQEETKDKLVLTKEEYADLSKAFQGFYLYLRNNKIDAKPFILDYTILNKRSAVKFNFNLVADKNTNDTYCVFPTTMTATTSVDKILEFYDLKLLGQMMFTLFDYKEIKLDEITFLFAHTDMLVNDITVTRTYAFDKPVDIIAGFESDLKKLEA